MMQSQSSPAQQASSDAQRRSSIIGLLGGSFDPIHNGHLQLARDAIAQLNLTELRLIPAGQPWQKGRTVASSAQRAHLVELSIAMQPIDVRNKLVLDMREIERNGNTYTVDTLRSLRSELGDAAPLVLIVGSDQLQRLDTWHDWQMLPSLAHLAVARRNKAALQLNDTLRTFFAPHWRDAAALHAMPCGLIAEFSMTPSDASATEIRMLLQQARNAEADARLKTMLPTAALDYIRHNNIYS